MGTSLTGLKIKDSYSGLLKTTDNGALGASAKLITDGLGNSSGVYLGTSGNLGIGESSPSRSIHISTDTPAIRFEDTTGSDYSELVSVNGDLYIRADEGNTQADSTIRFQIDQSEKMRILDTGGITFNGDTSTSNALDDYEEGTWTPQISNGTIDVAVSHTGSWYIKIGSLVTVSTRITNADLSSFALGDNPQIIGLPFTSSATSYSTVFLRGAVAGNILRYIQTVGSSSSILTDLTVSELVSGATDYFLTITYTV